MYVWERTVGGSNEMTSAEHNASAHREMEREQKWENGRIEICWRCFTYPALEYGGITFYQTLQKCPAGFCMCIQPCFPAANFRVLACHFITEFTLVRDYTHTHTHSEQRLMQHSRLLPFKWNKNTHTIRNL